MIQDTTDTVESISPMSDRVSTRERAKKRIAQWRDRARSRPLGMSFEDVMKVQKASRGETINYSLMAEVLCEKERRNLAK